MYRIRKAKPEAPGCLHLWFDNQEERIFDLSPLIERGGVFAKLEDPVFLEQVSIGGHGRFLSWPDDIDLCADAVWKGGIAAGQRRVG